MVQGSTVLLLGATAAVAFVTHLVLEYKKRVDRIRNFPGLRLLLSPRSAAGNLPPFEIPGVALGYDSSWLRGYKDFQRVGCDVISIISVFPRDQIVFYVADPAVAKEVLQNRARFPKPLEVFEQMMRYGSNIVASEGEEWKKHRKVVNPAFSEPNSKMVWSETMKIMENLFEKEWKDKDVVVIEHMNDLAFKLALMVLSTAGFGQDISYIENQEVPPGHTMTFSDALRTVSISFLLAIVFPQWFIHAIPQLRRTTVAVDELRDYMQKLIDERRSGEVKSKLDQNDLFTLLLEANSDESDTKLTDSELIGNVYIFLLAGQETTAHTLCFAVALLALYPDEQDAVYQSIKAIVPDGRLPTYEEINSLLLVKGVFYETLRLLAPVGTISTKAAEDTTLMVTNNTGERLVVPVPKGSEIIIYTPGLHYNPKYWKDPEAFRPQRFLDDWPRDAFLPFSSGPRACIGRRFTETETMTILTLLLLNYRIKVKDEPQFANETFEQRKARVLAGRPGLTWTPKRVPLVFERRR